ncbi:hypothetical protein RRG08_066837 [Elysia crispata]|uniref:Uncharacterized protein n=1 Tax=Elysia crispata TaxID=231223 RepID=A0AAE1CKR6_9GAST|nr:hypothetical protein RRG08_066837 [Elysia crispata]
MTLSKPSAILATSVTKTQQRSQKTAGDTALKLVTDLITSWTRPLSSTLHLSDCWRRGYSTRETPRDFPRLPETSQDMQRSIQHGVCVSARHG